MKREEIKGFRQPTNDEKEMIYGLLEKNFKNGEKSLTGVKWVMPVLSVVAIVKAVQLYKVWGNWIIVLFGFGIALLFLKIYREIAKQQNFERDKYCSLKQGNYLVKEVQMCSCEGAPDCYDGDSAYICDQNGNFCDDPILVKPMVTKVILRNDGRSLLMKLQNGAYFCLFAYAEDWKNYLTKKNK